MEALDVKRSIAEGDHVLQALLQFATELAGTLEAPVEPGAQALQGASASGGCAGHHARRGLRLEHGQ